MDNLEQSAKAINKLYLMANLMENILMTIPNPYKQLTKQQFNKVIKEVKRLNKFVNGTLSDTEIEGIDTITEEFNEMLKKYES